MSSRWRRKESDCDVTFLSIIHEQTSILSLRQCTQPFHPTCITHHLCKSVLCWRDIEFISFSVSAGKLKKEAMKMRRKEWKKWCYFGRKFEKQSNRNIKAQITSNKGFKGFPNNKHFKRRNRNRKKGFKLASSEAFHSMLSRDGEGFACPRGKFRSLSLELSKLTLLVKLSCWSFHCQYGKYQLMWISL